jgi:hypothetical protein
MDDVRFYNRVLTEQEIGQLYAVPIPAPVILLGSGLLGLAAIRKRFKNEA